MAVAVHMSTLLLERGLGQGTAVAAAAVLGGMQIPGRILLGPLERRVSARWLAAWVFLLQALGLVALATSTSAAGVFVFATSARAFAPLAASLAYGLAGGYQPVLWALVAISLAAVGAQYFVEGAAKGPLDLPNP
jgi:hypothetical protein